MKRYGLMITVAFAACLAFAGCSDDDTAGDGSTDGATSDTGSTTTEDTGGSTGEDTGETTGEDTGETSGEDGGSSGGDDAGGTGADTSDGGNGDDTSDGGNGDVDGGDDQDADVVEDFVVRDGAGPCPTTAAGRIQVGPGQQFQTVVGAGSDGDVEISKGEWVNFSWVGGATHTVTGDESTNFEDDLNDACQTDNTAWFDSGSRDSGIWCVQFNKTGTFNYQCTVGGHCENGMWGTIEVVE